MSLYDRLFPLGLLASMVALVAALSLTLCPHARADEQDDMFFYTLMKKGIVVGDHQTMLFNVTKICGRVMIGETPDTLATEIDAVEPGLDHALAKTLVLTAMQFYCQPDALHKDAV